MRRSWGCDDVGAPLDVGSDGTDVGTRPVDGDSVDDGTVLGPVNTVGDADGALLDVDGASVTEENG
jgi:hypothetical protein